MDFALENKINKRLNALKRGNVQFVSGTVSPSESDVDTMDIESLQRALAYFNEKGVERVMLQPKWMGSRCQLYLHRDEPEKNFAVTRNGFHIKQIDLTAVYESWNWVFDAIDTKTGNIATKIILDGELLPWKAIGGGLIEREFFGLTKCVETEMEFLRTQNFGRVRDEMGDSQDYINFEIDRSSTGAEAMDKALQAKYPRYDSLNNYQYIWDFYPRTVEQDLAKYKIQLAQYAKDGELEYKAFDILRVDFVDDTFMVDEDWMGSVVEKYTTLSKNYKSRELGMVLNVKDIHMIQNYFDELVTYGYEGFMIKPVTKGTYAVHCMKVRNKEYLRIIYGFDYDRPDKLEALVRGKRVGRKRKLSHQEHRLGLEMLKLDTKSPTYEEDFDRIAKALLFQIEEEEQLDSRL